MSTESTDVADSRGAYQQIPLTVEGMSILRQQKTWASKGFAENKKKYREQKYRFKDLESTTFDAFLYCVCSVVDTSLSHEKGAWLQFFFALGLQIVAVILQMGLVVLLFSTVVDELEAPYEHGLSDKIATLVDALEKHTIIDKSDPAVKLCRKDHTLLGVHIMVLWIWISKMLREVSYAFELIIIFWHVEATPSSDDDKHELRFLMSDHLCEPMNEARFLKQGKPKNASGKEKEMTNLEYWNEVMDKVGIRATELRRDSNKMWNDGHPMTLPDLYDEMEGVVNGLSQPEQPTALEFKKELEDVWATLEKVPYCATEVIDEDVVLNVKGHIVQESYTILYFTPFLRFVFIVFHAGLQITLAVGVMFVSAKYLFLSVNMGNVILKAVSMQFIMNIDAIIFAAFIPTTFAQKIKSAKIKYVGKKPTPKQQWSASFAYVIIAVSLTLLIRFVIFGYMDEFRDLCRAYYIANPSERNIPMDTLKTISDAFGEGFR